MASFLPFKDAAIGPIDCLQAPVAACFPQAGKIGEHAGIHHGLRQLWVHTVNSDEDYFSHTPCRPLENDAPADGNAASFDRKSEQCR